MKRIILSVLTLSIALFTSLGVASPAFAVDNGAKTQICNGIGLTGASAQDCTTGSGQTGVASLVKTVVEILSMIVGITAVIVIIVSGFKYITAGGEASKAGEAKNTLIYALVGLAVAALAQFLVHFVLGATASI